MKGSNISRVRSAECGVRSTKMFGSLPLNLPTFQPSNLPTFQPCISHLSIRPSEIYAPVIMFKDLVELVTQIGHADGAGLA